jgi:hypothetical protein
MGDLERRFSAAVKMIADQAKVNAAGWSARIPPSVRISGIYPEAVIRSGAPPAYPNEVPGVRHPVFGGRGTKRPEAPWVTNQHRPFLAPAADMKAGDAAQEFGNVIDDWAIALGYKFK